MSRARAFLAVFFALFVAGVAVAAAPARLQDYYPAIDLLGRGVTPSTGAVPYYPSGTSASTVPSTSYGRGTLNVADVAAARAYFDLEPGVDVCAYDADGAAYDALASTGLVTRTGAGTVTTRAIAVSGAGLSASNGSGVAGDPTVSLADDAAAIEALTGTSNTAYLRRTASNTWSFGSPTLQNVYDAGQSVTLGSNGLAVDGAQDVVFGGTTDLDEFRVDAWTYARLWSHYGVELESDLSIVLDGTTSIEDDLSVTGVSNLAGGLTLPQSTAPSQIIEARFAWDSDDDLLTVGSGSATLRLAPYQALITATGTWTAPSYLRGSALAIVECWGAGGGAGSGPRRPAGGIRAGGGGGGAGGYAVKRDGIVSDFTGLTVTIGAVGTGGAARTADDTTGADGVTGGTTSWGSLVVASGGRRGNGGSTSNATNVATSGSPGAWTMRTGGNAATPGANSLMPGSGGMASTASSGDNTQAGSGFAGISGGGGAGGGLTAANAATTSGAGGDAWTGTPGPAGSVTEGTAGAAGDPREGGAGGAYGNAAAAGAGGAGGTYGGGGGGGGGSTNGFNSGAGGAGGTGACRITVPAP